MVESQKPNRKQKPIVDDSPKCLECGERRIMEIRRGNDGYRGPAREGDFTLCMECGAVQKFAADLSLYTPTLDEMSETAVQGQMLVRGGDLKKP